MKFYLMKRIALLMSFCLLSGCSAAGSVLIDNNKEKKLESNSAFDNEMSEPVLSYPDFYRNYYNLDRSFAAVDCKEDIDAENIDDYDEEMDLRGMIETALEYYDESQRYRTEDDLENAIEALDKSYALVIDVHAQNRPELDQQVNNLRFMISKRIQEIYASTYTTVKGPYKAIPLVMNRYVEKEITRFLGYERKFFINAYKRSGRYRPQIVRALKKAGLPEELSWLPLIESGFKIKALSRARALGLWQFIPSTGYKFGLKRDRFIDERMNVEKSTEAAISYLKELHHIFGDWSTVLAAYNWGEGRVLRAIRKQKINYMDNFWELYEKLPYETARYVPRFLAALHIIKDPGKYNIDLGEPDSPLKYDSVPMKKQTHLKFISKMSGIGLRQLVDLNPDLKNRVTPDKMYYLKVPEGRGSIVAANIDKFPRWFMPVTRYKRHIVKRGESLSVIAKRYHTTVTGIMRLNGIRRSNFIKAGQKIKIPVGRGRSRKRAVYSGKLASDGSYRVIEGDSLWLIAKRFNTSTKILKELNGLQSSTLRIGQILKVVKL